MILSLLHAAAPRDVRPSLFGTTLLLATLAWICGTPCAPVSHALSLADESFYDTPANASILRSAAADAAKIPTKSLWTMPIEGTDLSSVRREILDLEGVERLRRWTQKPLVAQSKGIALGRSGDVDAKFRLGIAPKVLRPKLPNFEPNKLLTTDASIAYAIRGWRNLTAGLRLDNIGQEVNFLREEGKLPVHAALRLGSEAGRFAAELTAKQFLHERTTSAGANVGYKIGFMSFRAGYALRSGPRGKLNIADLNASDKAIQGVSGGFGLHRGTTRLDYAIAKLPAESSPSQHVTLTLQWGAAKSSKAK